MRTRILFSFHKILFGFLYKFGLFSLNKMFIGIRRDVFYIDSDCECENETTAWLSFFLWEINNGMKSGERCVLTR